MTKIKLKSGFGRGYLPTETTYKNYTMLVAIANYSTNDVCQGQAEWLLQGTTPVGDKERYISNCGGFMHAVITKDFASAWNKADGSNRKALLKGLELNEIEL